MSRFLRPPLRVTVLADAFPRPPHIAFSIDRPVTGAVLESYCFEINGFIATPPIAELPPATRIVARIDGHDVANAAIDIQRPDVATALGHPAGVPAGFSLLAPVYLLSPGATLDLFVYHTAPDGRDDTPYHLCSLVLTPLGVRLPTLSLPTLPTLLLINSLGRSGSSLVSRLLAADPRFLISTAFDQDGEMTLLSPLLQLLPIISSEGSITDLNRLSSDAEWRLLRPHYFFDPTLPAELARRLGSDTRRAAERMVRHLLRQRARLMLRRRPRARIIVEKSWNSSIAHLAPAVGLATREIILVRHPADFLRSQILYQGRIGLPAAEIRRHAQSAIEKIINLARGYALRQGTATLVRYEDLIANPTDTLQRILDTIGIPVSSALTAALETAMRPDDPHHQSHRTSDTAIDGSYLAYLTDFESPAQQRAYEAALLALGYSASA